MVIFGAAICYLGVQQEQKWMLTLGGLLIAGAVVFPCYDILPVIDLCGPCLKGDCANEG